MNRGTINIDPPTWPAMCEFIETGIGGKPEFLPFIRGRLTAINGTPVAELEGRDRSAGQGRLQPVGKIAANLLRADQVKLAGVGPHWRREDRQVGFVIVHEPCISERGSFVQ